MGVENILPRAFTKTSVSLGVSTLLVGDQLSLEKHPRPGRSSYTYGIQHGVSGSKACFHWWLADKAPVGCGVSNLVPVRT